MLTESVQYWADIFIQVPFWEAIKLVQMRYHHLCVYCILDHTLYLYLYLYFAGQVEHMACEPYMLANYDSLASISPVPRFNLLCYHNRPWAAVSCDNFASDSCFFLKTSRKGSLQTASTASRTTVLGLSLHPAWASTRRTILGIYFCAAWSLLVSRWNWPVQKCGTPKIQLLNFAKERYDHT